MKPYFNFEIWWLGIESFKENAELWGLSFTITSRSGFVLAENLKLLDGKLKEWSKNNKGNVKQKKRRFSTNYPIGRPLRNKESHR